MIGMTSARTLKGLFAATILAFVLPGASAQAQAPAGSRLVGTFSEWSVYTSQQGGAKVCYAVTQPKVRLPANLNRDPAYLFVSSRPKERVRNEISLVMGFPTHATKDAEAIVDKRSFKLVTKGTNAWVKDHAQESAVLSAFRSGSKVVVKSTSARGSSLSDEYSLSGVSAALQALGRECP